MTSNLFHIGTDEKGRDRIIFVPGLRFCKGLQMEPDTLEDELKSGCWLVLAFAVWSMPDVQTIPVAVSAVERMGGRLRLGVRPYDRPEEFEAWCPKAMSRSVRSPVWILSQDGQVQEIRRGVMPSGELENWLRQQA